MGRLTGTTIVLGAELYCRLLVTFGAYLIRIYLLVPLMGVKAIAHRRLSVNADKFGSGVHEVIETPCIQLLCRINCILCAMAFR